MKSGPGDAFMELIMFPLLWVVAYRVVGPWTLWLLAAGMVGGTALNYLHKKGA